MIAHIPNTPATYGMYDVSAGVAAKMPIMSILLQCRDPAYEFRQFHNAQINHGKCDEQHDQPRNDRCQAIKRLFHIFIMFGTGRHVCGDTGSGFSGLGHGFCDLPTQLAPIVRIQHTIRRPLRRHAPVNHCIHLTVNAPPLVPDAIDSGSVGQAVPFT